jgi:CubicO group peptidase (beta-lactamase class C family)
MRHSINIVRPTLAALVAAMIVAACSEDGNTTVEPPATTIAASTSVTATTEGLTVTPSTSPVTTAHEVAPTTTAAPSAAYDFTAIGPIVEEYVERNGMNGAGLVVVQRDDGIVHEQYWGEFAPDRISLVASSSKMVVAGVLMHLDDAGLLEIDAPVADVVEWGSANPTITPAQLVSNSSGLVGLFPDPGYSPYICQYLPGGTLQECAEQIFTTADDDADVVPPDTEFRYGGAQWQVAGAVAEIASGKSWSELINEIYVEPCGLTTLAFNNHFTQIGTSGFDYPAGFDGDPSTLAPTDNPNMEGGAYVAPPDYATLLLMHLRDGRCGDVQVLSPDAVQRMHDDRIGPTYDGAAGPNTGYGMGWWIDRSSGRISDPGAYGSFPWIEKDAGYAVYLVVESEGPIGAGLAAELFEPIDTAIAARAG